MKVHWDFGGGIFLQGVIAAFFAIKVPVRFPDFWEVIFSFMQLLSFNN